MHAPCKTALLASSCALAMACTPDPDPAQAGDTGNASDQACTEGVWPGNCPPEFTLPDATGRMVSFSELTDRVVVASWFSGW